MYSTCMVALQIRDVPDAVRDALAERARARGQSLQAFLLALVRAEAGRSHNLTVLARNANRGDGSVLGRAELAAELDRARAERERIE